MLTGSEAAAAALAPATCSSLDFAVAASATQLPLTSKAHLMDSEALDRMAATAKFSAGDVFEPAAVQLHRSIISQDVSSPSKSAPVTGALDATSDAQHPDVSPAAADTGKQPAPLTAAGQHPIQPPPTITVPSHSPPPTSPLSHPSLPAAPTPFSTTSPPPPSPPSPSSAPTTPITLQHVFSAAAAPSTDPQPPLSTGPPAASASDSPYPSLSQEPSSTTSGGPTTPPTLTIASPTAGASPPDEPPSQQPSSVSAAASDSSSLIEAAVAKIANMSGEQAYQNLMTLDDSAASSGYPAQVNGQMMEQLQLHHMQQQQQQGLSPLALEGQEEGPLQICFDFTKGACTRGSLCRYSHDVATIVHFNSREKGVCFDFLRNQCQRGLLCRFSHDVSNMAQQQQPPPQQQQPQQPMAAGAKARSTAICYDFVKGACVRGETCTFSHDLAMIARKAPRARTTRANEICYDFLRGRCMRGATCRFSHQVTYDPVTGFPTPAPMAPSMQQQQQQQQPMYGMPMQPQYAPPMSPMGPQMQPQMGQMGPHPMQSPHMGYVQQHTPSYPHPAYNAPPQMGGHSHAMSPDLSQQIPAMMTPPSGPPGAILTSPDQSSPHDAFQRSLAALSLSGAASPITPSSAYSPSFSPGGRHQPFGPTTHHAPSRMMQATGPHDYPPQPSAYPPSSALDPSRIATLRPLRTTQTSFPPGALTPTFTPTSGTPLHSDLLASGTATPSSPHLTPTYAPPSISAAQSVLLAMQRQPQPFTPTCRPLGTPDLYPRTHTPNMHDAAVATPPSATRMAPSAFGPTPTDMAGYPSALAAAPGGAPPAGNWGAPDPAAAAAGGGVEQQQWSPLDQARSLWTHMDGVPGAPAGMQ